MAHVPTMEIREFADIAFAHHLQAAEQPQADYDVGRWLYVPNTYTEYRYLLGTRGENPLVCIGVNPSTARPDKLDPTLQSVQRIALHNGFDSFLMLNVYAQRATAPEDMEGELNRRLHEENCKAFAYALSLSPSKTVWAAWGTIVEKRPFLIGCVRDLVAVGEEQGARWVHCGRLSKAGHPHHPLYLRSDAPLEPFSPDTYRVR